MGRIISVFLFVFAVVVFYAWRHSGVSLVSPVPAKAESDATKTPPKNGWFPEEKVKGTKTGTLELSARSAMIVDFDNKDVLYAKNENDKLPVASTVKVMTALVALEHAKLSNTFVVSQNAYKVGENSMDLSAGERLTLRELLYGLILVSGNDAAVTIAEGISGSEDKFVELMNQKVKDLGLSDTKFINASGLDEEGKEQYSTAYDMAVIAHYLWENYPEFRDISNTYHEYIEASAEHKAFDLYNDTNLLTTYPGVRGIKPGFTWGAGLCLVTYAENKNKKLLAVVLGSDDRRGEMKELLDFGFNSYGIHVPHPALDIQAAPGIARGTAGRKS